MDVATSHVPSHVAEAPAPLSGNTNVFGGNPHTCSVRSWYVKNSSSTIATEPRSPSSMTGSKRDCSPIGAALINSPLGSSRSILARKHSSNDIAMCCVFKRRPAPCATRSDFLSNGFRMIGLKKRRDRRLSGAPSLCVSATISMDSYSLATSPTLTVAPKKDPRP